MTTPAHFFANFVNGKIRANHTLPSTITRVKEAHVNNTYHIKAGKKSFLFIYNIWLYMLLWRYEYH